MSAQPFSTGAPSAPNERRCPVAPSRAHGRPDTRPNHSAGTGGHPGATAGVSCVAGAPSPDPRTLRSGIVEGTKGGRSTASRRRVRRAHWSRPDSPWTHPPPLWTHGVGPPALGKKALDPLDPLDPPRRRSWQKLWSDGEGWVESLARVRARTRGGGSGGSGGSTPEKQAFVGPTPVGPVGPATGGWVQHSGHGRSPSHGRQTGQAGRT